MKRFLLGISMRKYIQSEVSSGAERGEGHDLRVPKAEVPPDMSKWSQSTVGAVQMSRGI